MKDEELILKAVEYCNDIPARVKDFLREEKPKEEPKPVFEVGNWIIRIDGSLYPKHPSRVTEVRGTAVCYMDSVSNENERQSVGIRLATPKEIETHLMEICDEKYVGKQVMCLEDGGIFFVAKPDHYTSWDTLWYKDNKGLSVKVYGQGKWATIIPEKKKLPNNKEDLGRLIMLYHDQNDGIPFEEPIDEFLKDYED